MYGVENFHVVSKQDEKLLVGAPLDIKLIVFTIKRPRSDEALLVIFKHFFNCRGDGGDEDEDNETVISVVDVK